MGIHTLTTQFCVVRSSNSHYTTSFIHRASGKRYTKSLRNYSHISNSTLCCNLVAMRLSLSSFGRTTALYTSSRLFIFNGISGRRTRAAVIIKRHHNYEVFLLLYKFDFSNTSILRNLSSHPLSYPILLKKIFYILCLDFMIIW